MTARDVANNFFEDGSVFKGTTTHQVMRREPVDLEISGGAVAMDLNRSSLFRLSLTAAAAISNPVAGEVAGTEFVMYITQDATGGRAVTWGTDYNWGDGGAPDFDNDAANAITVVHGHVVSATEILMTAIRGENTSGTSAEFDDLTVEDDAAVGGDLTVTGTINAITVLTGSADPTAGGGVAATIPALYIRTSNGALYSKDGAAATDWALVTVTT